ncbi:hypothetical protein RB195_021523 [Necator americanus]|uniref:Uncharacterized protein n=1 Tax=Necator americanus TaxID=51031 RepID=A0ABR1EBR4_NECAM
MGDLLNNRRQPQVDRKDNERNSVVDRENAEKLTDNRIANTISKGSLLRRGPGYADSSDAARETMGSWRQRLHFHSISRVNPERSTDRTTELHFTPETILIKIDD